ncbi:MAG: prepilin-type N-terminal cleavage/methylation domain-containing protein [Candidatus Latescibacteria bacterium]|nr:prepilin-type N-terminal cleavage/methylation domain-containing protein [Candidatus Latescibacterota bacterium]
MMKPNESGFSFVELMIVMVVIGIMAGLAVPSLNLVFKKDKLRTSTATVTASLYTARMKAVNEAEPYGVQFDEGGSGNFYIIRDPEGANEIRGAGYSLESGISISENNFEDWLVIFNEFGQLEKSCLTGGEMTGTIIITNSSIDSTKVELNYLTGRIRERNL